MSDFRNRIYELRKDAQMSQQQLADKIGVNKQTISQYERGVREPQFDTLGKLCDFFNVSIDYLLGRDSVTMRLLTSDELRLVNAYRAGSPAAAPLQLTPLEEKIITRYRISPVTIQGAVCDILHVSQEDADNTQYSESNNTDVG